MYHGQYQFLHDKWRKFDQPLKNKTKKCLPESEGPEREPRPQKIKVSQGERMYVVCCCLEGRSFTGGCSLITEMCTSWLLR